MASTMRRAGASHRDKHEHEQHATFRGLWHGGAVRPGHRTDLAEAVYQLKRALRWQTARHGMDRRDRGRGGRWVGVYRWPGARSHRGGGPYPESPGSRQQRAPIRSVSQGVEHGSRTAACCVSVAVMAEPADGSDSVPPPPRVRLWAALLLVLSAGVAWLVVTVSYGLALEYGDIAATQMDIAAKSFRDWGFGIVVVVGLAGGAVVAARRSRGRRTIRVIAAVVVVVTVVGVPAGAVLGVQQKFHGYPDLPSCAGGFGTSPAAPVVAAAQARFVELDHPGRFSGGGSAGVDGCLTQLAVRQDVDVPAAYRSTLVATGWRIGQDDPDLVTATRDGQAFEASRDRDGSWWVWIGPKGLHTQPSQPGEVTPRQ